MFFIGASKLCMKSMKILVLKSFRLASYMVTGLGLLLLKTNYSYILYYLLLSLKITHYSTYYILSQEVTSNNIRAKTNIPNIRIRFRVHL